MVMENSQMLYINILEISNIIYTMEMDNLLSIKISMLDSSNKEWNTVQEEIKDPWIMTENGRTTNQMEMVY